MLGRSIRCIRAFLGDDSGSISVWSLFLFLTASCVAGFAADVTNFYALRTQLQITADNVARAALFRRAQGASSAQAIADAVAVGRYAMASGSYGNEVRPEDIVFGRYDQGSDLFSPDPTSTEAVLVQLGRTDARSNAVPSFFLRLVGVPEVNISASAVVVADGGSLCLRDGMIANGVVDVQSNNQWRNGWCIHSNDHVEVNQNSLFESGVIVSMPDLDLFEMPASGFQQNQGLQAALRDNVRYTIGILDRIRPGSTNSLYTALRTPGSPERPSYITNDTLHTTRPNGDIVPGSFVQGRVHEWTCTGNQDLTFKPANNGSNVYSNFVLLTNCDIQLAGNVELRNVVIFTTSQSAQSIKASGGGGGNNGSVNIGQADSCAAGGGAQIITRGGFKAPAGLQLNGGQIIAWGDIQFAAQGAGGRGASLIANGRIDGTSNLAFTGCGGAGMEGNFTVQSQRLAR